MNVTRTLPVEQVKALDRVAVAQRAGLEPVAEGKAKYPCIVCDSSDAMHIDSRRIRCYSCGWHGTNIDLVMQVRGLAFADAVAWLADAFGIFRDHRTAPPLRANPRPSAPAEPVDLHADVYDALVDAAELADGGRGFLASRGVPPLCAHEARFRSFDTRADWDRVARALTERFDVDRIRAAIPSAPWGGVPPMLLIPYRYRGRNLALRFRKLTPRDKQDRYRDLDGRRSPVPFMADALDDLTGHDLHVCEGELDAFTLWGTWSDRRVIGVPGASQLPGGRDAPWLRLAGAARRVFCWHDQDAAGNEAAAQLSEALRIANGWTAADAARRVLRLEWQGGDVNDLARAGELVPLMRLLEAA